MSSQIYFHIFVKLPNCSSQATSMKLHLAICFKYTTLLFFGN